MNKKTIEQAARVLERLKKRKWLKRGLQGRMMAKAAEAVEDTPQVKVPYSGGIRSQYHKKVKGIQWNPRMEGHLEGMDDAAEAVQPWDRYTEVKKGLRQVEESFDKSHDASEHLSESGRERVRRRMEQLLEDAKKRGELRFGPDPEDLRNLRFENRRAGMALKGSQRDEEIARLEKGSKQDQMKAAMMRGMRKDSLGQAAWEASTQKARNRYRKVGIAASTPFKGDKIESLLGRGKKKTQALNIRQELEERYKEPRQYNWVVGPEKGVKGEGTKIGEDLIKRVARESSDPEGDIKMMQERVPHLLRLAENRADHFVGQGPDGLAGGALSRFARVKGLMRQGDAPEIVKKVMATGAMGGVKMGLPLQIQRAMAQGLEKWEPDPPTGPRYAAGANPVAKSIMRNQRKKKNIIQVHDGEGRVGDGKGRQVGSITPAQVPHILNASKDGQGPAKEVAGKPVDTWVKMHLEGKRQVESKQQIEDLLTLRAVERGEKSLESVENPRLRMLIKTVLGSKKK